LRAPGVRWIQGSIVGVDCASKTVSFKRLHHTDLIIEEYDFFIAATGIKRQWPSAPQSLTRKEYIIEANDHAHVARNALQGVAVIGGGTFLLQYRRVYGPDSLEGAVGVEMAAELKLISPHILVTLIHSREQLLSSEPLPAEFKDRALQCLLEAGVDVKTGSRVIDLEERKSSNGSTTYTLILADGSQVKCSHVVRAVSNGSPSNSYLPSLLLDSEGYVQLDKQ